MKLYHQRAPQPQKVMALSTDDIKKKKKPFLAFTGNVSSHKDRQLTYTVSYCHHVTALGAVKPLYRGTHTQHCVAQHHSSFPKTSRLSLPIQSHRAISFCKNFKYYLHSKAARAKKQFVAAQSVSSLISGDVSEDISVGAFLFPLLDMQSGSI